MLLHLYVECAYLKQKAKDLPLSNNFSHNVHGPGAISYFLSILLPNILLFLEKKAFPGKF